MAEDSNTLALETSYPQLGFLYEAFENYTETKNPRSINDAISLVTKELGPDDDNALTMEEALLSAVSIAPLTIALTENLAEITCRCSLQNSSKFAQRFIKGVTHIAKKSKKHWEIAQAQTQTRNLMSLMKHKHDLVIIMPNGEDGSLIEGLTKALETIDTELNSKDLEKKPEPMTLIYFRKEMMNIGMDITNTNGINANKFNL